MLRKVSSTPQKQPAPNVAVAMVTPARYEDDFAGTSNPFSKVVESRRGQGKSVQTPPRTAMSERRDERE